MGWVRGQLIRESNDVSVCQLEGDGQLPRNDFFMITRHRTHCHWSRRVFISVDRETSNALDHLKSPGLNDNRWYISAVSCNSEGSSVSNPNKQFWSIVSKPHNRAMDAVTAAHVERFESWLLYRFLTCFRDAASAWVVKHLFKRRGFGDNCLQKVTRGLKSGYVTNKQWQLTACAENRIEYG